MDVCMVCFSLDEVSLSLLHLIDKPSNASSTIRMKRVVKYRLRKLVVIALSWYIIYRLVSRVFLHQDDDVNSGQKVVSLRDSLEFSPFTLIKKKQDYLKSKYGNDIDRLNRETFMDKSTNFIKFYNNKDYYFENVGEKLLINYWNESNIEEKCEYLFNSIYKIAPNWDNHKSTTFYGHDAIDNELLSLMVENLRIYDYCVMKNNVKPKNLQLEVNVLHDKLVGIDSDGNGVGSDKDDDSIKKAFDLQLRMFPFLNNATLGDLRTNYFYPSIFNVNENKTMELPRELLDFSPLEYNINFFANYKSILKDKGISMTMRSEDLMMFKKMINVLDFQNNTLPIQIITKGNNELTKENFINELQSFLQNNNSTQTVFIVNVETLLNKHYVENMLNFFYNKWVSIIFSTFKETIFLDVDSIPFVNLDEFYFQENNINNDYKNYKDTGMLMYKDRMLINEFTFGYCMDALKFVEPSLQESQLINSNILFNSTSPKIDDITSIENTNDREIYNIYNNFLTKIFAIISISGLVVINKDKKLFSLIFSLMMNLNGKLQRCVYGDKEFFWLGQLFAGERFTVNTHDGSIIGPLMVSIIDDPERKYELYQICSTQMAHGDLRSKNVIWTNGGLKTCKIENSAENDFNSDREYFQNRYNDVETLNNVYQSPLSIDALVIPETEIEPWLQLKECSKYVYCASARVPPTSESSDDKEDGKVGDIIKFDDITKNYYNDIAKLWAKEV
ncbi:hypothetical protein TPHA_0L00820 [Tetrapisispora phaffii CBS 4417]|uniref:Alpha-1,3-mannosyltransferase n=1 Tax=Tetrapisispora phaffii (strain ATCC 24235 / CBS 4417 / NBRC 1672 / NRRL Y-8282 / UCD 70-5) TaxID=1071381 RepID=G8BZW1_TETPH|nr:hypothetical protein TPHA_0L00820 [Tetrapisispora phaffii CBS 4417]CCE65439.1 hypothetical protein TPHA_0L00820 [Tetrapisispora phaffii CBS 4417]